MWAAAITSVIGAAFTSVSFLKTFHEIISVKNNFFIIGFIICSTIFFVIVGRPVEVLVWAGTINGFILPIGLSLILLASRKKKIIGEYRHPIWLQITGWLVVLIMFGFSILTLYNSLR
jgi:Mn2+/Fe2+ NRAMP family transporter